MTLSLRELDLEVEYRSLEKDLIKEFYIPCLSKSTGYDRAVGYFTGGGLSAASVGIAHLISNDGKMRLVASPNLKQEDIDAIELGYKLKNQVIEESILKELESIDDAFLKRIRNLAWLISNNKLDIRIAIRTDDKGHPHRGIFHEKVGVFTDISGNKVAFSGSSNETYEGLVENYEDINVFTSWNEPGRVQKKSDHFELLWNNSVLGLTVIDFPEAARKKLLSYKPENPISEKEYSKTTSQTLRPYQIAAIESWETSNRIGILCMATGTGKTIVALEGIRPLTKQGIVPIIVVPSDSLIYQWMNAIEKVYPGSRCLACHGGYSTWEGGLVKILDSSQDGYNGKTRFIVATMATASKDRFLKLVSQQAKPEKTVIVIDEVHRVGAQTYRTVLGLKPLYRLGLSATPIRQWDRLGTEAVFDYFNKVVFNYPLGDAIRDKYLSPYEYRIFPVSMSPEEVDSYEDLSRNLAFRIESLMKKHPELRGISITRILSGIEAIEGDEDVSKITSLLISRRRIIKKAAEKITTVKKMCAIIPNRTCLIYCEDFDQLDEIKNQMLLLHLHPAEYTSRLDNETRNRILEALRRGNIKIVLSCKCLDEGVDIPSCDAGILIANSKSEREFIQRRGRLLRLDPGKESSLILDLLVVPSDKVDEKRFLSDVLKGILISELHRSSIFARDAINRQEAENDIKKIADNFAINLEDIYSDINGAEE